MPRPAAFVLASLAAAALNAAAAQPGYVDPAQCARCHADLARSYGRTGMGRSFYSAGKDIALPGFEGGTLFHNASRELFTFSRHDGIPYIRRSQPGADGVESNVFEERIDYVIGAGDQAISFLHRTRDNKLTEFPVSWYAENGGHWDMSPAYDRPDHPGFSREVNFACMLCHNAYPAQASADDSPAETVFPERLPEGIDCQRCHGPGQNHVDAASHGKTAPQIRESIVNPARLNADRQSEVCLQCHLETTSSRLPASLLRPGRGIFSYRPGEPLPDFILAFERAPGAAAGDLPELVSAPYRLAKSSCRFTGGRPLTCLTCHDPHLAVSRAESVARTNGTCAGCHRAALATLARDGRHAAQADCVSCHMPQRRTADVVHASITDHWISRPHDSVPPVREINARNAPPYAGEVTLYYPKALAPTPENTLWLALSQVQSNPREALRQLDRLTANAGTSAWDARFAAEIAHAFLLLSQPQKALDRYREAVVKSPENVSYLSGLGNAQQAAGRPDLAGESFARVAALAPRETDVLLSLGQAYVKQGRLADAILALRKATNRNPESAAAFNDLGSTLLRMSGAPGSGASLQEAEAALREAVRIQPELISIRMNLADALIRERKLPEASAQLEEAIRIGGRGETAEAAWYAALIATGSAEQAAKAWNASFVSQVSGAHNNLGTIFVSEHKPDEAIREYRLAVEGDPQSALAQFNLGLTLFGRGLKAEAIPLLKKAADSPDPGIRAAARSLLEKP